MMPRLPFRPSKMLVLPLLAASVCAACQPADADPEEVAADGAAALPAIHVRLDWENLLGGRHTGRDDYQARLRICEEAGVAATPLGPADIARLDTGTVEIRIDAGRQAVRQTAWTLGFDDSDDSVAGSCRFRLVEDDYEEVAGDAGIAFAPLGASRPQEFTGWTALGEASVGGQPCTRWRKSAALGAPEEVCVWSGGREWGFDDAPLSTLGCDGIDVSGYLTAIPLEARPLEGSGCIVKLRSFSIGAGGLPGAPAPANGPEGES